MRYSRPFSFRHYIVLDWKATDCRPCLVHPCGGGTVLVQAGAGQQESILVFYKHPSAGVPLAALASTLLEPIISNLPYLGLGALGLISLSLIAYICASLRSAPAPLPPVQLNVAPFTPMGARYSSGTPSGSYYSPAFTPSSSPAATRDSDVGIQNFSPGWYNGGAPPIDSSY